MNGDIVILSTNGNRKHEIVEEAERHSMWLHEAMHYFNFVVHVDAAYVKPKEKKTQTNIQTFGGLSGIRGALDGSFLENIKFHWHTNMC